MYYSPFWKLFLNFGSEFAASMNTMRNGPEARQGAGQSPDLAGERSKIKTDLSGSVRPVQDRRDPKNNEIPCATRYGNSKNHTTQYSVIISNYK